VRVNAPTLLAYKKLLAGNVEQEIYLIWILCLVFLNVLRLVPSRLLFLHLIFILDMTSPSAGTLLFMWTVHPILL
jgi:hypothetical protein